MTTADTAFPEAGAAYADARQGAARIAVTGGRVIDPASRTDRAADVFVEAGRIVGIGQAPAGFAAQRTLDAAGCWVLPGLVDLAARLREPGFEHRATLESEMRAALAGGVTSLSCPPDTDPTLDEPGLVEMLKHRARMLNQARLFPLGALTVGLKGDTITEMAELAEAGCVGFSHALAPLVDTQVLVRAMQYARTFDFVVWLHPQEAHLSRGGVAHAGAVASRMGLPGVPVMAETVALHTIFEAVRATGCRVHLCRLSSAAGVELVRQARREGLPVTADVAVHHLHLTDVDIGFFDPNCRVEPPFRSQRDRDALRAALADGTIDAICSDHTPVDDDAKQLPFGEAEPGVTALELLLPLTLQWARQTGTAPLDAVARITCRAAAVLRAGGASRPGGEAQAGRPAQPGGTARPGGQAPAGGAPQSAAAAGVPAAAAEAAVADVQASCGALRVGGAADLCVVDPQAHWVCGTDTLVSQGSHTPFSGVELTGRVRATLVDGRVAFER